jgi:hypothetical protein
MIDMTIPGLMTEGELHGIEELARRVPSGGSIVETGPLYGLSSFTWATSVKPGVVIYCIDPWIRDPWIIELEKQIPNCPTFSLSAFKYYTRSCANIVPIVGYSPADVRGWGKLVDLFFDDSVHENPFFGRNLRFWVRKMRPGGIMCGHDYCLEWPDVIAEVNRLADEIEMPVHTRERLWWIELPNKLPRQVIQWTPVTRWTFEIRCLARRGAILTNSVLRRIRKILPKNLFGLG